MTNQGNIPKLVGVVILKTPGLVVRCGGEFLRFRKQARRAGHIFQDELEAQGLEPTIAQQLSEIYSKGSDPTRFLRAIR